MAVSSSSPLVYVVVPTYNERDNIVELIRRLSALGVPRLNVLVVDDGSPDGTGQVVEEIGASDTSVHVLHRAVKDGLGRAYVAGMMAALEAGADVVIQMDADLSHPTEVIPTMLERLRTADVVVGSRYVEGGSVAADWPWHRRLLSWGANVYVEAILRLGIKDSTAGFKAWRADALRTIHLPSIHSNGYAFQVEMGYRASLSGLRTVETPIRFVERADGTSKMSLKVQLESAVMPWHLRARRRELVAVAPAGATGTAPTA